MKIPIPFLVLAVGAMVSLQAWTLNTVIDLKSDVAALKVSLKYNLTKK